MVHVWVPQRYVPHHLILFVFGNLCHYHHIIFIMSVRDTITSLPSIFSIGTFLRTRSTGDTFGNTILYLITSSSPCVLWVTLLLAVLFATFSSNNLGFGTNKFFFSFRALTSSVSLLKPLWGDALIFIPHP